MMASPVVVSTEGTHMKQSIIAAVAAVVLCTVLYEARASAAEAAAKPGAFKECFGATVPSVEAASTGKVVPPEKLTQLPAGFTVVGGGAKGPDGFVVLCR
jgi:aromatic ring hydroxylase